MASRIPSFQQMVLPVRISGGLKSAPKMQKAALRGRRFYSIRLDIFFARIYNSLVTFKPHGREVRQAPLCYKF